MSEIVLTNLLGSHPEHGIPNISYHLQLTYTEWCQKLYYPINSRRLRVITDQIIWNFRILHLHGWLSISDFQADEKGLPCHGAKIVQIEDCIFNLDLTSLLKSFQIPIVPKVMPRPERNNGAADSNQNNVPPEQINNFVYESPHDRLVMDFGEIKVCVYTV